MMNAIPFTVACILGVAARIWLAQSGYNYDINCFWNDVQRLGSCSWIDISQPWGPETSFGPLGFLYYLIPGCGAVSITGSGSV